MPVVLALLSLFVPLNSAIAKHLGVEHAVAVSLLQLLRGPVQQHVICGSA